MLNASDYIEVRADKKARNEMMRFFDWLLKADRIDDAKKACRDEVYMNLLYKEFETSNSLQEKQ